MRTFTFGFDHTHPVTGESLARCYIQVPGDSDESRAIMNAVFGQNWAMQYVDTSKLKYLDRMTEVKWTEELIASAKDHIIEELESVTGNRLRKHLLDQQAAEEMAEAAAATTAIIDEYFDTGNLQPTAELDALNKEAYVGEGVTEYGLKMLTSVELFSNAPDLEAVYPMAKKISHSKMYGGRVLRRRVLVLEDWVEVTDEEATELMKPYLEHVVDLTPKGVQLP